MNIKKYIQFYRGTNPFNSQAKMLFHIDKLYDYLYKKDCYPIFMEIALTNKCNLNCGWCINSNFRNNESLNLNKLSLFLRDFKKFNGKAITYSGGGEPTLYDNFIDAVQIASYNKLEIGLLTNGSYTEKKYNEVIGNNVRWVRISVDTINKSKYKKWKGIDVLDNVIYNVNSLQKYPTKVGINCNINMEHTIIDVKKLISFFIDKVQYIQFRPVLPRYYKKEKPEINEKVWNYLKKINNPNINISDDKLKDMIENKGLDFNICDGHFFEPVLTADGNLSVCMYHPKNDNFIFGNIYNNSFDEIWKSKKRKKVIQFIRNLDYEANCQFCCKCAEINKFLDYINHPHQGGDINFL